MTHEHLEQEFTALSPSQQIAIVAGAPGDFASTVGWFVGYAVGCTLAACAFNAQIMSGVL